MLTPKGGFLLGLGDRSRKGAKNEDEGFKRKKSSKLVISKSTARI